MKLCKNFIPYSITLTKKNSYIVFSYNFLWKLHETAFTKYAVADAVFEIISGKMLVENRK